MTRGKYHIQTKRCINTGVIQVIKTRKEFENMSDYPEECDLKNKQREEQVQKAGLKFKSRGEHKTIEKRYFQQVLMLKLERKRIQDEKHQLEEEITYYMSELLRENVYLY